MLDVVRKVPGFRYRWVSKDPANMDKKQREGWAHVNQMTGLEGEHIAPGNAADGKPLTSLKEYRDLTLMAMPEEMAQERDRYFQEKTLAQTAGLKKRAEEANEDNARKYGADPTGVRGKIVIE
ncbi:MAG: hypothetical protein C4523_02475 [Myxococcales bacterium]|nr:MAG: hypothetical protein C4523_02475 [Myxococcales bacterium]